MTISLNEMHARANAFVKAHSEDDAERAAFLFERYAELTADTRP